VPQVKAYIQNQKEHHKKISFKEEMLKIFADLGIDHSEEYGFVWLGDGVDDES
jgi:putative transposase